MTYLMHSHHRLCNLNILSEYVTYIVFTDHDAITGSNYSYLEGTSLLTDEYLGQYLIS